jgi:hypothetical protein
MPGGLVSVRDWLVVMVLAITASVSPWCFRYLIELRYLRCIEEEMLQRKFGDIPMFAGYFAQLGRRHLGGMWRPARAPPRGAGWGAARGRTAGSRGRRRAM